MMLYGCFAFVPVYNNYELAVASRMPCNEIAVIKIYTYVHTKMYACKRIHMYVHM